MSLNLESNFLQFEIGMENGNKHSIYGFDRFRLDVDRLMLYDGEREVQLPPKCVNTLAVLVENAGEIISKDELIDAVWRDTIVEESNLSQYLYLLRKTLGDTPDGKPYIETLRRRGYRFNGEPKLTELPLTKNGKSAAAPASQPVARPYEVERHGNVIALVNRHEPSRVEAKPIIHQARNYWRAVALVALIVLAAATVPLAVVWLRSESGATAAAEPRAELTFERLTNGINPQFATISPDGKHFAYSDYDGETWSMFVQQTGQSNRLELIPPSGRKILEKTFSPDGQFIYFLAQDSGNVQTSLYRIPTLGGVQTKILDDCAGLVSFSPDGKEMVFERFNEKTGESAFVIAAQDGSTERILLSRDRGQERFVFPAWSPDGTTIAFVTMPKPEQGSHMGISAINLQTGEIASISREKWANCYRLAWMHDGRGLVFVGTKIGEALSTRRDNVFYLSIQTGEARCLTVDGNRYQLTSLGVTQDGAVFAVPDSRLSQIWQMSPNGDARTAVQITHGLQDGRVGVAPLPDGRVGYIARTGEYLNLWLMNADGTEQRQLTTDPRYIEELRASPDGEFFVFSAKYNGGTHFFRVDADGANLKQLTFRDDVRVDSTISADGKWIVFESGVFDGRGDKHTLFKIPSSGGSDPVRVSDADCAMPHFSPDGEFLSCVGAKEIFVLRSSTGEVVKTFEIVQPALFNNGASWTPDGQNLVYRVVRQKVANLWLQPLSGGAARQLTDFTTHDVWNFAYSRDGLRLYVVRVYQANDAVLIRNF